MSRMTLRFLSVVSVMALGVGCDEVIKVDLPGVGEEEVPNFENCIGNSATTGSTFGSGYYPDQASSGEECQCSYSYTDTDLKIASVFEAAGYDTEPLAHQMTIASAFSTGTKNPDEGASPNVGWDWYSKIES